MRDGPLPERVRLVVLFGGRSAEHEVSCTSAASVLRSVDPRRYDVVPVGITAEGRWVLDPASARRLAEGAPALTAEGEEVDPLPTVAETGDAPVVVLPLLHGPHGEDGTVQGLLELAGVPFVGSGVLGSALAMDKAKAKEVLGAAGLPQARYLAKRDVDVVPELAKEVDRELGWPVFVKPANLGSSVGVSKVHEPDGLAAAVETALGFDEWVLVEEAVVGRELECGVLGDVDLEASVVGEVVPAGEFYDYEDKYADGGATLVVPADVPEEVAEEARRLALEAARALRSEGMARVDFFYEAGAKGRGLLVNEVNTIPGFTASSSMFPRLWAASGVPYAELIDRLVAAALSRHQRRAGRIGRQRTS